MNVQELLKRFRDVAKNPSGQKDAYLNNGQKVVLTAPVYAPEEIIHSMGVVPMGAWGGDIELRESKKYFPAFICSIAQSLVELGVKGTYDGVSAIVISNLCDSLKALGENWKYAVRSIPFIPMNYPQNRKPDFGAAYTRAGYERVIRDLEHATGFYFDANKLSESIEIYNEHNSAMRELAVLLGDHPEITVSQRSDIFKSAYFMLKEAHTALVREFIAELKTQSPGPPKIRIMTTGIIADAPALTGILDEYQMQIAADDIAAESRQYRTNAPEADDPLHRLVLKYCAMDNCSVLYDPQKTRIGMICKQAVEVKAQGVLVVLTKFCDPEEFDYPLIKKSCEVAGLPCALIEADRQMVNYEQARTIVETFRDLLVSN